MNFHTHYRQVLLLFFVLILFTQFFAIFDFGFVPSVYATEYDLLFSSDFEGEDAEWTTLTNNGVADLNATANPYAGSEHGRFNATDGSTANYAWANVSFDESHSEVIIKMYVSLVNDRPCFVIYTYGTTTTLFQVLLKPDSNVIRFFYWLNGAWSNEEKSATIDTDNYYNLTVWAKIDDSAGFYKTYFDTVLKHDKSGDTTGRGDFKAFRVGCNLHTSDVYGFDAVTDVDNVEVYIVSSAPSVSNHAYETTAASTLNDFNWTCTDETALHPNGQYEFGWNSSGSWSWDSAVNFTSTPETITVTKTNPSEGTYVEYALNITDNEGNSYSTLDYGTLSFTTTSGTATYITGDTSLLTYPYNTTTNGTVATIKAKWTTDGTLYDHWISTDFADGTNYVNGSHTLFYGSQWSNITVTLPSSLDVYHAKIYANTTDGKENVTSIITITTVGNYTHFMEDVTPTLLQSAIDTATIASENASIYLPAGTFDWTSGGTLTQISMTNGIYLFGAPTERDEDDQVVEWRTILQMNDKVETEDADDQPAFFAVTLNETRTDQTFRMSDIKLIGYRYFDWLENGTPDFTVPYTGEGEHGLEEMYRGVVVYLSEDEENATAGMDNMRIDHCHFQDMCGNAIWIEASSAERNRRTVHAVIDHNILVNSYGDPGRFTTSSYENRTLGYGIGIRRWSSDVWEDDFLDVIMQENNYTVFIEDNVFGKWRHCICTNDGMHSVVRYNLFNVTYGVGDVDQHGSYADESHDWAVGTRAAEIYNNTFQNPDRTWDSTYAFAVNHRGGCAIITNNTIINYTCLTFLNNEYGNVYFQPKCSINNTYIWGNTLNGASIIGYCYGSTENVTHFLYEPTVELSGFVYVPYPYPHWLTDGESPTYYYLTVESATGGTTDPEAGEHAYLDGSYAVIEAFPESGYSLATPLWTLDAGDGGSDNPTSVYMTADHTIQSNFVVNQSSAYDYSIDFTNQMVYVQLTYNGTSDPVPSESCSFAGGSDTTNSTGWAEFSLSSLSDFSYNTTAYPTSYPNNNITVPLAKKTLAIEAVNVSNTLSGFSYEGTKFCWSATGSGATSFKIYYSDTIYYLKIDGVTHYEGDSWSKSGNVVTVTDDLSSTHSYELTYYVSGGAVSSGFTDPLFVYFLEGDFLGFIFACYTQTIGSTIYAIGIFFISAVVYLRSKSLFIVSLIWIFVGSLFIGLFREFSFLAGMFSLLGIGGVLVEFVFVWRHKQ